MIYLLMKNIGTNLKHCREARSYTQQYIAEKIGISQSNYARIENNKVLISAERLKKIAEILDTTEERIASFNESTIFNTTQGGDLAAGGNCVVHNYQISDEIKKLYEDKISLLEEKMLLLEKQNEALLKGQL